MFGEWTKVVKINEKMKSTRYFFKSSRESNAYAPKRKLNRSEHSPEEVQKTVHRIKSIQSQLARKKVLYSLGLIILIVAISVLINERVFF